ncbi:hypothetical protein BN940_05456 [Castellaniella defragrans 65Phen]|uniref:Uncharacterized protein n=1 Tax=Castellaniella defragrans (strain DSM 12143 / CCUG 39792 / 65Phen) TaxID=1437824 RepID=W8X8S0_CASD6|nr:hypothetical protein BN940_05456 [Castellaniella defragrans 65Phen]
MVHRIERKKKWKRERRGASPSRSGRILAFSRRGHHCGLMITHCDC